jgi:ankyrin repeat protein
MDLLLAHGANIESAGPAALSAAAENGHAPAIEWLCKHGVPVDALYYEKTALLHAVRWNHGAAVRTLLAHGANALVRDFKTPLICLDLKDTEALALLAAADPGSIPLAFELACRTPSRGALVAFWLSQGANPRLTTKLGQSMIDLAHKNGNTLAVQALAAAGLDSNEIDAALKNEAALFAKLEEREHTLFAALSPAAKKLVVGMTKKWERLATKVASELRESSEMNDLIGNLWFGGECDRVNPEGWSDAVRTELVSYANALATKRAYDDARKWIEDLFFEIHRAVARPDTHKSVYLRHAASKK